MSGAKLARKECFQTSYVSIISELKQTDAVAVRVGNS